MKYTEELRRRQRAGLLSQISTTDRLIRQIYIRAAARLEKQAEGAKDEESDPALAGGLFPIRAAGDRPHEPGNRSSRHLGLGSLRADPRGRSGGISGTRRGNGRAAAFRQLYGRAVPLPNRRAGGADRRANVYGRANPVPEDLGRPQAACRAASRRSSLRASLSSRARIRLRVHWRPMSIRRRPARWTGAACTRTRPLR